MRAEATTSVTVRLCQTIKELEACVRLQKQIWVYAEGESYPVRLFVNLTHIGGQVIGAFSGSGGVGEELVGFVAGMPAWRRGKRYLHSLSLGVAPGHENQGLGRRLKLEQRRLSIRSGIRWIEWTFDPMRAKNAFFNLVRLGAIARRYEPDYYGRVQSRLQQGLPSDRLVCEWWLRSPRARGAVRDAAQDAFAARNKVINTSRGWDNVAGKPALAIAIPADFRALAGEEPERARKQQASVRRKFEAAFRRGLVATDFERGERISRYLLEPFDES